MTGSAPAPRPYAADVEPDADEPAGNDDRDRDLVELEDAERELASLEDELGGADGTTGA